MKTKLLFILSALALSPCLYAHVISIDEKDNEKKPYSFGLCLGAGFTASDKANGNLLPYAYPGIHFNATLGHCVYKGFGLMGMFSVNRNAFNGDAYTNARHQDNGLLTTSFSGTPFLFGAFLFGPFFSLPINDKFEFNIHVLGGYMNVRYPSITANYGNAIFQETFVQSNTFGYNAGFGLTYNAFSKLGFLLNVSYLGGNSSKSTYSVNTYSTDVTLPYVGIVNASAGVVFKL